MLAGAKGFNQQWYMKYIHYYQLQNNSFVFVVEHFDMVVSWSEISKASVFLQEKADVSTAGILLGRLSLKKDPTGI